MKSLDARQNVIIRGLSFMHPLGADPFDAAFSDPVSASRFSV